MSTRSLPASLKKIEFRWVPATEPRKIIISIFNSKGKILYEMRFGKGGNEYISVDGQPISKEEADQLCAASTVP